MAMYAEHAAPLTLRPPCHRAVTGRHVSSDSHSARDGPVAIRPAVREPLSKPCSSQLPWPLQICACSVEKAAETAFAGVPRVPARCLAAA